MLKVRLTPVVASYLFGVFIPTMIGMHCNVNSTIFMFMFFYPVFYYLITLVPAVITIYPANIFILLHNIVRAVDFTIV